MSTLDKALIGVEIVRPPRGFDLSRGARLLNVEAYVWSRANHTDGVIPSGALRWMTDEPKANAAAAELVSAGVWAKAPGGWLIPDFLDSQSSAERVARIRANDRTRYDRFIDGQGGKRQRVGNGVVGAKRARGGTRGGSGQRVDNGVANGAALHRSAPQGEGGAARRVAAAAKASAARVAGACFYCANSETASLPFEVDTITGRVSHTYDEVADGMACPPMRDGFVACVGCEGAFPPSMMMTVANGKVCDECVASRASR